MAPASRLVGVVAFICLLLAGCGTDASEMSCSCAAGTTYNGSFYQQYANTAVRAGDSLGQSDPAQDCCGEPVGQRAVYAIEGIDADIAIATKDSDGRTYFNVASDLTAQQQLVAERFAKKHHQPDEP